MVKEIKKEDKKYVEYKIDMIEAEMAGCIGGAYMLGNIGAKYNTGATDRAYPEIEKMIWQIFKRGYKSK